MHSIQKAALIRRLAFSLTILSLFIACEDPGSVGGNFVDQSEVLVDTVLISSLPLSTANPYLGKLTLSAIGEFDDQMFGSIKTQAFFKPEIDYFSATDSVISLSSDLTMRLRFSEDDTYGNTETTANYSVFRVNELWRGSTYTKEDTLTFGNEVIATFSDADIDSLGFVDFELGGSWKEDYVNFFNVKGDSLREASYRDNDFGLAIVSDVGNEKINYVSFGFSSLLIISSDTNSVSIADWTVDITRSGEVSEIDRIKVHSTYDTYLTLNLKELIDQASTNDFIRVELVLVQDTSALSNSLNVGEVRSPASGFRLIQGPLDDNDDRAYEFSFSSDAVNGFYIDGAYRFNISTLVNDDAYADSPIEEVYLFPFSSNGVLGYSSIYSPGVDLQFAPKIIIYGLE